MRKAFWLTGGLCSVAALCQGVPAWAETAVTTPEQDIPDLSPIAPPESISCPTSLDAAACAGPEEDGMAQVRSVSELSDIQPSDWAYQAVRSLIERYGVAAGYPDGTFRGNQPLTRYEFAAAVAQLLATVEQLAATGGITTSVREDLDTLRRLQTTYGTIANSLRDRLNPLDGVITQLEAKQFSATSKLSGQTVLAVTDGTNASSTVLNRVRLNINTSFSPNSQLVTQLESGNNGGDALSRVSNRRQNLLGTTGSLADGGGADYVGVDDRVRLSKLYYTFQPAPSLTVAIGARVNPRDFIDYNRFANESTENYSSSFFMNNPLIVQNAIDRPGGAGAAVVWSVPNLPLTVRALYVAADADRPTSGLTEGGLFGDRNQGSLEVQYDFSRALTARLQYTTATVNNTDISALGFNAEWAITRYVGVFGRVAFGSYEGTNSVLNRRLDLSPWTWAVGATVRNLVIPGSTAGVAVGQPFVEDDFGTANQTNFEGFFTFLLNDNISFTPAILVVTNPNNDRSNGTVWQWLVRMVFSF